MKFQRGYDIESYAIIRPIETVDLQELHQNLPNSSTVSVRSDTFLQWQINEETTEPQLNIRVFNGELCVSPTLNENVSVSNAVSTAVSYQYNTIPSYLPETATKQPKFYSEFTVQLYPDHTLLVTDACSPLKFPKINQFYGELKISNGAIAETAIDNTVTVQKYPLIESKQELEHAISNVLQQLNDLLTFEER